MLKNNKLPKIMQLVIFKSRNWSQSNLNLKTEMLEFTVWIPELSWALTSGYSRWGKDRGKNKEQDKRQESTSQTMY
jgi:hypothetical protein